MAQKAQALKPILAYPNTVIAQLYGQVNQQLAMLKWIRSVLPIGLADHALHCVLNNKKLLVFTDSANWASQLRFYSKIMLATINSNHPATAAALQVKIMNDTALAKTNQKSKAVIPSHKVANEIRQQSFLTTDLQLKQALEKLSSTLSCLQNRK